MAKEDVPVSVVICGKNALKEFESNLSSILSQRHYHFEVVVVDDHSTDDTAKFLGELVTSYDNLRLVSKEDVPDRPGKKAALYAGVKAAKHEIVIVTDADCYPASKLWLRHITSRFNENTNLVLGISPNEKESGFLKGLFRFETILTAMFYVSFALRGMPYMGVGRNMAFRRDHFLKNFVQILEGNLASGDDDLYVNFSAKKETTAVCTHPDSYTLSASPDTFKQWFRQKQRHLTAGFHYRWSHQLLLALFPIAQFVGIVAFVYLLSSSIVWFAIMIGLFQLFVQQVIHAFILRKMKQIDLALEFPIYQFIWVFLLPILSIFSFFKSKSQWN